MVHHQRIFASALRSTMRKSSREALADCAAFCTFATVRHRTIRSRGCLSNKTALAAWQPNPGRGSTYRRGKSVQTTETTSVRGPVQLTRRVSSTSVTVITPGTGCSITSTATVSTGCFTFRAAFFTGAGLGLALATVGFVAFAALDTLRALPRLAGLRSFARFCTFDAFLRLAMIRPPLVVA